MDDGLDDIASHLTPDLSHADARFDAGVAVIKVGSEMGDLARSVGLFACKLALNDITTCANVVCVQFIRWDDDADACLADQGTGVWQHHDQPHRVEQQGLPAHNISHPFSHSL